MSSAVVLSPTLNVSNTVRSVASVRTPTKGIRTDVCTPTEPVRNPAYRRPVPPNGSDSPPLKKLKKGHNRRKKRKFKNKRICLRTKPVAPFNTTQFLMAEHDHKIHESSFQVVLQRPQRNRESSMSMDSDQEPEDDDYSGPEQDDEFLTKEFWTAYEDVHAERLDTMTKAQLVQEYLGLEERVDILERQLKVFKARQRHQRRYKTDDEDDEVKPGEVKVDEETAAKIEIFRQEIQKLEQENNNLRRENTQLKERSDSSSSSSSDSSSSGTESSSDSDSDSEGESVADPTEEGRVALPLRTVKSLTTQLDSGVSCGCGSSSDDLRVDDMEASSAGKYDKAPSSADKCEMGVSSAEKYELGALTPEKGEIKALSPEKCEIASSAEQSKSLESDIPLVQNTEDNVEVGGDDIVQNKDSDRSRVKQNVSPSLILNEVSTFDSDTNNSCPTPIFSVIDKTENCDKLCSQLDNGSGNSLEK